MELRDLEISVKGFGSLRLRGQLTLKAYKDKWVFVCFGLLGISETYLEKGVTLTFHPKEGAELKNYGDAEVKMIGLSDGWSPLRLLFTKGEEKKTVTIILAGLFFRGDLLLMQQIEEAESWEWTF